MFLHILAFLVYFRYKLWKAFILLNCGGAVFMVTEARRGAAVLAAPTARKRRHSIVNLLKIKHLKHYIQVLMRKNELFMIFFCCRQKLPQPVEARCVTHVHTPHGLYTSAGSTRVFLH